MRGSISEAVIIVILGFLIGGIAAAVVHFMIDSKYPPLPPMRRSAATLLTKDPNLHDLALQGTSWVEEFHTQ